MLTEGAKKQNGKISNQHTDHCEMPRCSLNASGVSSLLNCVKSKK